MTKSKRIWFPLAVVLAAVALALGFSGAAYAGTDSPHESITGSEVWFTNNGDVVHVHDTACDNHAALARVQAPHEGIYEEIWNHNGCGTTIQYSYGIRIDEGSTVYVEACIGVGTTADVCAGYYVSGVA
jgi:hypothetical protein